MNEEQIRLWLETLQSSSASHYKQAYRAVGDIGSVQLDLIARGMVPTSFMIFGLVRMAPLYINSQLSVFHEEGIAQSLASQITTELQQIYIQFPILASMIGTDRELGLFAWTCAQWASYATAEVPQYRLKDLVENTEYLRQTIETISDIQIPPDDPFVSILETLQGQRINSHLSHTTINPYDIAHIYQMEWNTGQRSIFDVVCGETMRTIFPEVPLTV